MTKNNKLLVSIIIPVYNGENYLKEAIDSALNQTYENIEIIVVNDGSKDKTEEIAKSYGNRIKYFKKENGGVSSALNMGIKKMSGEFFSWLSHDDTFLPNKIETLMGKFNSFKNEKIILYSDYLLIDKDSNITSLCKKDHSLLSIKNEYSLLTGSVNGITMLIPKCAFNDCGLFNEKLRCTQDYDLWMRMAKLYKFVHVPSYLACTRIHENQDTITNPLVIDEGNELWINLVNSIPDNRKIELESSIYGYYERLSNFLKNTPYDSAFNYTVQKMKEIEEETRKSVSNISVSVIIPFFNRIDLTIRSIKSVLNQSFQNIEIVLVDDCSTSNIDEILKMVDQYSSIKYYKNTKNLGAGGSRNTGIDKAQGDYIAFLDSDDEFYEDKIEKQLLSMIVHNSSASYTNYVSIIKSKTCKVDSYTEITDQKNEFIYNCKLATPTIMVKSELLKKNSIKYKTNYRICEDACFYLDIIKKEKFLFINEFLSKVYIDKNSCINDYSKRKQGLLNLIDYVLNDEYYNKFEKEIEILFMGCINFDYLEKVQNDKTPVIRKYYRKVFSLKFRKKLKEPVNYVIRKFKKRGRK